MAYYPPLAAQDGLVLVVRGYHDDAYEDAYVTLTEDNNWVASFKNFYPDSYYLYELLEGETELNEDAINFRRRSYQNSSLWEDNGSQENPLSIDYLGAVTNFDNWDYDGTHEDYYFTGKVLYLDADELLIGEGKGRSMLIELIRIEGH